MAQKIYLYMRMTGLETSSSANKHVGLETVIRAPDENINPASHYSGSAVGRGNVAVIMRYMQEF